MTFKVGDHVLAAEDVLDGIGDGMRTYWYGASVTGVADGTTFVKYYDGKTDLVENNDVDDFFAVGDSIQADFSTGPKSTGDWWDAKIAAIEGSSLDALKFLVVFDKVGRNRREIMSLPLSKVRIVEVMKQ